jgi:DNA-binding response OmpR family regulator
MGVRTVLLVNRDLGFVFWLGQALDAIGYEAYPAKTVQDATRLVKELSLQLDLLIIDPETAGAMGFIAAAKLSWPGVRVMAVYDRNEPEDLLGIDNALPKPTVVGEHCRQTWLENVASVLGGEGMKSKDNGTPIVSRPITSSTRNT